MKQACLGVTILLSSCGTANPEVDSDACANCEPEPNRAPTVTLTLTPSSVVPGDSLRIGVDASDPDDDELETTFLVESVTVEGLDCMDEFDARLAANVITVGVPFAHADVRCADELLVSVVASDGNLETTSSIQFSIAAPETLGLDWEETPANPAVTLPSCPDWHCLNQADPTLGEDSNGDLLLWFSTGGDRHPDKPAIARAVEQPDGSFDVTPNVPVMEPYEMGVAPDPLPWDYARETPSIRRNEQADRWSMVYLGYLTDYFTDPSIGFAESLDAEGTQWPRGEPIYTPSRPGSWDEDFLTSPQIVLGSDGVLRLYFVGASFAFGGGMKVGMLSSNDGGETWTPHTSNPIFEGVPGGWDESILDCAVAFVGGRYMMWYTSFVEPFALDGRFEIGVATSEDGYVWQRHADNPVISPSAVATDWNSASVLNGEVLLRADGTLVMAAYAHSQTPPIPTIPTFDPGRVGIWTSQ